MGFMKKQDKQAMLPSYCKYKTYKYCNKMLFEDKVLLEENHPHLGIKQPWRKHIKGFSGKNVMRKKLFQIDPEVFEIEENVLKHFHEG
jgi:hypothetical protein